MHKIDDRAGGFGHGLKKSVLGRGVLENFGGLSGLAGGVLESFAAGRSEADRKIFEGATKAGHLVAFEMRED